jgi:hypothetical protein
MKKSTKPLLHVAAISSGALTAAEQRLIRAFRKIDDSAQKFTLDNTDGLAEDPKFQRRTMKPALRLVAGGAA